MEDLIGDQTYEKFMSAANKINYTNNKASDDGMDYDDDLAEEAEDSLGVALNVLDQIAGLRDKFRPSLNRSHQYLIYQVKENKFSCNFFENTGRFIFLGLHDKSFNETHPQ